MSKEADVRLNETVGQVVPAFPTNGIALKEAIQFQLMRNFADGPARAGLSAVISIGGLHFGGKARRSLQRIYLLALGTIGGRTTQALAAEKTRIENFDEAAMRKLIQTIAGTRKLNPRQSNLNWLNHLPMPCPAQRRRPIAPWPRPGACSPPCIKTSRQRCSPRPNGYGTSAGSADE